VSQIPLPGFSRPNKIVNVASVKHRSPFRYPGGKTWFVPRIRQWLVSLPQKPANFIEPFAGGAIVGLTVAAEELAEHVTLAELDEAVAAVWKTIIHGDAEWLADAIVDFDLDRDTIGEFLSAEALPLREQALQTIVKNRVNRGGILAPGAGMVKHGEDGRGILSRWYPETLARRIREIYLIRDRLTFLHGDGLHVIAGNARKKDVVFFIDPPYTAGGKEAGRRLYRYWELDHDGLFALASKVQGDVLMTYSNCAQVRELAAKHGFDVQPIAMKNTHHAEMTELVVGRDLDWLRCGSQT
jgi:DNA adenine methylase